MSNHNWQFAGHDELARIRKLRDGGRLDEAERLLLKSEPSEAVLNELRKVLSTRAWIAKKQGDWESVISNLESYTRYATRWRQYCIHLVNAEPPEHTARDKKLLSTAREELGRG